MDESQPDFIPPEAEKVKTVGAVRQGELYTTDKEFFLRFSSREASVVRQSIRECEDVSSTIAGSMRENWLVGSLSSLNQTISALRWYEENEANIGEDKIAYDARLACNHAKPVVRKKLELNRD